MVKGHCVQDFAETFGLWIYQFAGIACTCIAAQHIFKPFSNPLCAF